MFSRICFLEYNGSVSPSMVGSLLDYVNQDGTGIVISEKDYLAFDLKELLK